MHTMVDDSSAERECTGSVPHNLAVPAILQRADRLLQKSGESPDCGSAVAKLTMG
jgi:hypothetical protein